MAQRFVSPFFDAGSGITPKDGALLEFFVTGTSTPKNTFTDEGLTTPNSNPVVADANGLFPDIWLPDGDRYKVTLDDKNSSQKWEADPIVAGISAGVVLRSFDTVAAMVASGQLNVGDIVQTAGYLAKGDGGDNQYEVVAAGTGSDDGGSFVDLDTHQAKGLFPKGKINTKQFGAVANGSTDDSTVFSNTATFTDVIFLTPASYNVPTGNFSGITFISFGEVTILNNTTISVRDLSVIETVDVAGFNREKLMMEMDLSSFPNTSIQGVAIDQINGHLYVTQRVSGTTSTNTERTRIHQFDLKEDGSSNAPIASSDPLGTIGHSQDLSIEYVDKENDPTDIRVWTRGPALLASAPDPDEGKTIIRIDVSPGNGIGGLDGLADTDTSLFESFQLFAPDGTPAVESADFFRMTPTISRDGTYITASYVNSTDENDRRCSIWNLADVLAVDSGDRSDYTEFTEISAFPIPRLARSTIQAITMDEQSNIYLGSGDAAWEDLSRIAKLSNDGSLQTMTFVSHGRPAVEGSITQHEMEGMDFYEKDGKLHIAVGVIHDDGLGGDEVRYLYGLGFGSEVNNVKQGVKNSGAILDLTDTGGTREVAYNDGEAFVFGTWDRTTFVETHRHTLGATTISAGNDISAQSIISVSTSDGRELLQFRAKEDQAGGGWINLYGGADSGSTDDEVIIGGGSSTGVLRVKDGQVMMTGLPTSNPGGSGLLWDDSGILKIT